MSKSAAARSERGNQLLQAHVAAECDRLALLVFIEARNQRHRDRLDPAKVHRRRSHRSASRLLTRQVTQGHLNWSPMGLLGRRQLQDRAQASDVTNSDGRPDRGLRPGVLARTARRGSRMPRRGVARSPLRKPERQPPTAARQPAESSPSEALQRPGSPSASVFPRSA